MTRLFFLTLSVLFFLPTEPAAAQTGEPPREPVLRIETGTHTAAIRRIGVDAANRYLVTASDDKTVRVWELPSGRLLRVIRVPVGAGHEGKLFAVAISPDGGTIAASGFTGITGLPGQENIYLFDRESGRLTRRLGRMPNAVNHLAYSPDGRFLAAALSGNNGVRVFSTATYALTGEDRLYGDQSYGADFDRAGRLATTSSDGFIRLYATGPDGSVRLLTRRKAAGGERPLDVKFSPDGERLAVGYDGTTKVEVLRADDLAPLYAPDTTGVQNHLFAVAWSADGGTLYAGGRAQDETSTVFIRTWAGGGRGRYRDIPAAASTIMHILPLRDGGIIYGAYDPSFGVIDAGGRRQLFISPATAEYRSLLGGFRLAPDGTGVQFAYQISGRAPARFSLADRQLDAAPAGAVNWRPAETEDGALRVTDWNSSYEPKLNGTPLRLDPYEYSYSLAFTPDRSGFLLGTHFGLHLFDRTGAERWRFAAPGVAWAVNISADGRLAVAAYGDGTIRWHSMKDGRELLAFFPHSDRKRWILWTPSGFYDASAGAEDLIGWHVNNGRDAAADFFPVGQFRNVYYRPDVVSKIIRAGDEQVALRGANEEAGRRQQQEAEVARLLPPVVEIVSPSDGSDVAANEVTVRFKLRTPSGEPVTEVRALVDGRPAAAERNLSVLSASEAGAARELRVPVPAGGESQVSVIASNRFTTSVPATVRVRGRAPASGPQQAGASIASAADAAAAGSPFEIKPKLYVLAVGVSAYADPKLNLNFAAKDARDVAAAWDRQRGALYRDVVVKTLTDGQATKDEILDGLDWLRKETTSKDVAVVLFAGHGINDQNGQYYFLPHNADTERLLRTGVSFNDIKSTVSTLAGKTLFFIDTCHSGNVLGTTRRALANDLNGVVNELASAENGAVVFAASTGRQYSQEKAEWNNGAFTMAVVEGLGGRADFVGRGRITINMLDLYISERVKELTRGQQTPTTAKPSTVPDFPVALKKL
jgi:hypothetical protein